MSFSAVLGSIGVNIGADLTGLEQGLASGIAKLSNFNSQVGNLARRAGGNFTGFVQGARTAGEQAASNLASGFNTVNGKLAASYAELDKKQREFEKGFGRLGASFTSVGQNFTKYVTLPIAAGLALSGNAAVEFESAFAGVKKTLNTTGLDAQQTEKEYARLSAGIREMAKTIPAGTTEISKVAEAAGQLGIKRENVLSFTRVMIDLGNATNLSADQAATSLARLANITQLPQDKFQNLGSSIVALGNNFATTEAEITEMGLRLAGAGKQIGLTDADILGLATALSSVGINAEAGGTAFSSVFKRIQVAVETGGASLRNFAKVSGQTTDEFTKNFKTNAAGALVSFIEGLGKIKASGGSTLATLSELDLADIRVSDSLLRVAGAGDLARRAIDLSGKAFSENTALTKEAEQRYATTASKIEVAKNKIADLGITIGNNLLPALGLMAGAVGTLADGFQALGPVAQTSITALVGIAGAIGPLALAIGGIITSLAPGGLLITGLKGLGTAVTAATGPIGIAVVAIAALGAGLYYLATAGERAMDSYKEQAAATNALTTSINPLLDRYDALTTKLDANGKKAKLNAAEQDELSKIMQQVAATVPGATKAIDENGRVTEISTKYTREYIEAQEELTRQKAIDVLPGAKEKLANLQKDMNSLLAKREQFNKTGTLAFEVNDGFGNVYIERVGAASAEVRKMQVDLAATNVALLEQKSVVDNLTRSVNGVTVSYGRALPEFAGLGQAAREAARDIQALAAAQAASEAVQSGSLNTLAKLRESLKAAKEAKENQTLGSAEFRQSEALILKLQAQIDKYDSVGKAAKKTATEQERAFLDVQKKLTSIDTQVKLGFITPGIEATQAKVKALEEGLVKLSEAGVKATNPRLQSLNNQLLRLSQTLNAGIEPLELRVADVKIDRTIGDKIGKDFAAIISPALANRPIDLPLNLPKFDDGSNALANSAMKVAEGMRAVNSASLAFGENFDVAGARMAVMREEIQRLLDAGVNPLSPAILKLKADLTELESIERTADIVAGAAETIGTGLATLVTGAGTAGGVLQSIFGSLLGVLADYMKQYGKKLILLGAADFALGNFAGAALKFAAGGALIAGAAVATAYGSSLQSQSQSRPPTAAASTPSASSSRTQLNTVNLNVSFEPVRFAMEGGVLAGVLRVNDRRLTMPRNG